MLKVSVRVQSNRFREIAAAVQREMEALNSETSGELQKEMRDRVPIDTGATWQGIQVSPGHDGYTVQVTRNGDPEVPEFIEYGTATNPAQPFFWPAVEAVRSRHRGKAAARLRKATRGR